MAKKYKLREGVVKTAVCGETLLVATAAVREICPFTVYMNDASEYMLSLLEQEMSDAERVAKIAEYCGISEEMARDDTASYLNAMQNEYRMLVEEN